MNPKQIPKTDSIEELARFFDAHDMADFDDQFEDVAEPVFDGENAFTLKLPTGEANAIRKLAKSKGIPEADLMRDWVIERIHAQ